jgi:DNA-binding beta-propeller fold protein YncE
MTIPTKTAFALLLSSGLLPAAHAQPGAFNPPLLDCGSDGAVELICGTRAPEDFEVTPDGRQLIIANFGSGDDFPLDLYDFATKQFSEIPLTADKASGWGDPACTESIGAQVSPHGLSLTQRTSGQWQFYVVNHNVRESVEMYELLQNDAQWALIWRGCVLADEPYNDVYALADGSFVATRPQAIQTEGQDLFAGAPTGNVGVWTAADGEVVLPGTEYGYPNGVVASSDGRYAFVSGWTTKDFKKYDLVEQREVGQVDLGFMPDNLTWTPGGKILAAGIKGVQGNCPADSEDPCLQGMVVAEVDPATLAVEILYDNQGKAWINGTSVAIEADGAIWVGSFQGDRMVRLPR